MLERQVLDLSFSVCSSPFSASLVFHYHNPRLQTLQHDWGKFSKKRAIEGLIRKISGLVVCHNKIGPHLALDRFVNGASDSPFLWRANLRTPPADRWRSRLGWTAGLGRSVPQSV